MEKESLENESLEEPEMSSVVALGESHELDGLALAGVRVLRADTDESMVAAFDELDDDVGLIILTEQSARALREPLDRHPRLLRVVLPTATSAHAATSER